MPRMNGTAASRGALKGPLTTRALKTRAAFGDPIPTDEIRRGLGGNWQLAKLASGLQFASTTRTNDPAPERKSEQGPDPRFRYKMIQIPPTIEITGNAAKASAAARYLESLVN